MASPASSPLALPPIVHGLIRVIVRDPRRISEAGKYRVRFFADMLTRGLGLVPHDADLLLRIAAHSGEPECLCDLVAWARQNAMRAAVETAFDRILGDFNDPAYLALGNIVRDPRSSAAIRGLSWDGNVH